MLFRSLVEVRLGRSPYLAPLSTMDAAAADRLGLDLELARQRTADLAREPALIQKLQAVFASPPQDAVDADPEYRIYSGGFFRDEDKDAMQAVHEAIATLGPSEARPQAYAMPFIDERLPQLVRRLFARNWPATLSQSEQARWRSFCAGRLLCPRLEGATDLAVFSKTVESLIANLDTPAEDKPVLLELLEYRGTLERDILSYENAAVAKTGRR